MRAADRAVRRRAGGGFLRGLQERGLNELALDYLEQMKTSQAVDEEFREKIPYHRGVVLIEQSRQSTDPATRSRLLDEARTELEQFAEANPENVQGAEAQLELASVQMAGGQQLVAQLAQLPTEPAYDCAATNAGPRGASHVRRSAQHVRAGEAIYSAELEKLPPTTGRRQSDAGNTPAGIPRHASPSCDSSRLKRNSKRRRSYPPDADEFRKLNEAAAAELAAVYEEFAQHDSSSVCTRACTKAAVTRRSATIQLALGCYRRDSRADQRAAAVSQVDRQRGASQGGGADRAGKVRRGDRSLQRVPARRQGGRGKAARMARRAIPAGRSAAEERRSAVGATRSNSASCWPRRATPIESSRIRRASFKRRATAASPRCRKSADGKSGDKEDEPKTFQAAYDLGQGCAGIVQRGQARPALRGDETIRTRCPSSKPR